MCIGFEGRIDNPEIHILNTDGEDWEKVSLRGGPLRWANEESRIYHMYTHM